MRSRCEWCDRHECECSAADKKKHGQHVKCDLCQKWTPVDDTVELEPVKKIGRNRCPLRFRAALAGGVHHVKLRGAAGEALRPCGHCGVINCDCNKGGRI